MGINFVLWDQLKKNLYFHKDNKFLYLQKKIQKIIKKIEAIGTSLKSKLPLEGTNGPLVVKGTHTN